MAQVNTFTQADIMKDINMSTYREDMLAKAKKVDTKLYEAMTRINFNEIGRAHV